MKKMIALLLSLMMLTFAALAQEDEDSFSYEELEGLDFCFSSGAGAWSTYLHIEPDGSFTAQYHDAEMGEDGEAYPDGTVYISVANGQLGEPEQVNGFTWKLPVEELKPYQNGQTEVIEDGVRFVYVDMPYGLENAGYLLLYRQGAPLNSLPEAFLSWAHAADAPENEGKLPYYGLYNEKAECGFISEDRYTDLSELPAKLDVSSLPEECELIACISEESFLENSLLLLVAEEYRYDADALRRLEPGQVVHLPEGYCTVESVEEREGEILLNGGFDEGNGFTFELRQAETNEAALLLNGDPVIRRLGQVEIPFAETVKYTEAETDEDGNYLEEMADFDVKGENFSVWLHEHWGEDSIYYDYYNATVIIRNGRIAGIKMNILPEMDD